MEIDLEMRTLISNLLSHGYDTWHSCAGHGDYEPYVTFRRGTGDGSFEREAHLYGLSLAEKRPCCVRSNNPYCTQCGSSKEFVVYRGQIGDSFVIKTE